MSTYKGIPFNGGMDSPTGTGAQNIVQTCKAVADWLVNGTDAGQAKDTAGAISINWLTREMRDSDGNTSVLWNDRQLVYANTVASIDWNQSILRASDNTASLDWQNRVLLDPSANAILEWGAALKLPNMGTSDPLIVGQIWNNLGILTISNG